MFFKSGKKFFVNGWILGFNTIEDDESADIKTVKAHLENEIISKKKFKELRNGIMGERAMNVMDDPNIFVIAIDLMIQDAWTGEFRMHVRKVAREFNEVFNSISTSEAIQI